MARIRTIKPDYYTSLDTAGLSIEAFALFPGLLTHADDEGRFIDEPRLVKAALAPLRDAITAGDVDKILGEYVDAGLVARYEVDGIGYCQIVKFDDHQVINRPKPSKYPPKPAGHEAAPTRHGRVSDGSRPEGNREQGTGNREPTLLTADAVEVEPVPDFDDWWKPYLAIARGRPTGAGNRRPAEQQWNRLKPDERRKAVAALAPLAELMALRDRGRDDPFPMQHGRTHLSRRGFDDVARELEDLQTPAALANAPPKRDDTGARLAAMFDEQRGTA